eukprot:jgi/Chlat1/1024/Chrsp109S01459
MERWNTHHSVSVEVELFDHVLRLSQDPNSNHLGTTVWDSSIVLAKRRRAEEGSTRGAKCAASARLNSGLAVASPALREVLPVLRRNVTNNVSPQALKAQGSPLIGDVGRVDVEELDWGNASHAERVNPPFDYVIAADVVYSEHLVKLFIDTLLHVSDHRTTIMIANELRSETVHALFLSSLQPHFNVKKVLKSKFDDVYRHASLDIFILKRLRAPKQESPTLPSPASSPVLLPPACDDNNINARDTTQDPAEDLPTVASIKEESGDVVSDTREGEGVEECKEDRVNDREGPQQQDQQEQRKKSWHARRDGAHAARLLAGIRINGEET